MATAWGGVLRGQILDRRQRVRAALAGGGEQARLVGLLQEIDSTLERIDAGSYGQCLGCEKPLEEDRLIADPLTRFCLGCLTSEQQRALEEDLDLAARIQAGMLPKARNFPGWEVSLHYEPAGPVSGDYCDLVNDERAPEDLLFLVGDVSGKGVAASLLMTHLHAIFRSLTALGLPVEELVARANRVFCGNTIATHYATLVCGRTSGGGEVSLCNAGHCLPLLVRAGEVSPVESTGLPIGILCDAPYSSTAVRLEPGEVLVLYTDGLSEACNEAEEEYGIDRFSDLLCRYSGLAANALASACLEDLARFRSRAPARDDLTLMVIRRLAA